MSRLKLYSFSRTLSGDLDTPVSLYLKLAQKQSFLLESVSGGERVGRYSIIGFDPLIEYRANEDGSGKITGLINRDISHPVDSLQSVFDELDVDLSGCDRFPFAGGAVGFFSWEAMAYMDRIAESNKPPLGFPLAHFIFPGKMLIVDHAFQTVSVVIFSRSSDVTEAQQIIDRVATQIRRPVAESFWNPMPLFRGDPYEFATSNLSKADFIQKVEETKRHIFEGDIFQLVLSQKFSLPANSDPFSVYRRLRQLNPSPYMFFINHSDYQIIGSSPEILVKLSNSKAEVRPIAGTRPRTDHNESDVIAGLKADEKERAEHIMLVDLGRNDLGRVCEYGSVVTSDIMEIEKYSHVIHMTSHVEGKLAEGHTALDLLKATFPAGTVSGAPKIRAVEIINRLEPEKRGLYAGSLGYIDFRGNMDMCIAIRTALAKNGRYFVQAGGGLVADSVPESEYEESRNKAKGILQACLEGNGGSPA